jgi:hypothetical protein
MTFIQIIVVLIVVGVLLYLVQTYIPMAEPIKTIVYVLTVFLVCMWLLYAFGIWNPGTVPGGK